MGVATSTGTPSSFLAGFKLFIMIQPPDTGKLTLPNLERIQSARSTFVIIAFHLKFGLAGFAINQSPLVVFHVSETAVLG